MFASCLVGSEMCIRDSASVVYQLAYTSRCEHAIDPREDLHRRARPTLRRDGAELLRRAGLDP